MTIDERARKIAESIQTDMIAVWMTDGSYEPRTVGQWIADRIRKLIEE